MIYILFGESKAPQHFFIGGMIQRLKRFTSQPDGSRYRPDERAAPLKSGWNMFIGWLDRDQIEQRRDSNPFVSALNMHPTAYLPNNICRRGQNHIWPCWQPSDGDICLQDTCLTCGMVNPLLCAEVKTKERGQRIADSLGKKHLLQMNIQTGFKCLF